MVVLQHNLYILLQIIVVDSLTCSEGLHGNQLKLNARRIALSFFIRLKQELRVWRYMPRPLVFIQVKAFWREILLTRWSTSQSVIQTMH